AMTRPVRELARTIQDQDVRSLALYPGIGEATAERIVAKLRRKVGKFALIVGPGATDDAHAPQAEANGAPEHAEPEVIRDTFAALLSVGHTESQARQAIDLVLAAKKKYRSVADMIDAIYKTRTDD
ncbi:MAG TPA: Holliday junction DNA helicase RuvA, partial [Isosphaeraceae bacterium]|nr:Holliday junction DNA helicase RuvA [Isosphaeraceae bacterium]